MGGRRNKGRKRKGGSTLNHKLLLHYLQDYKELVTRLYNSETKKQTQKALTQDHGIQPTTIDGVQLPILEHRLVLEQPFLAFPKDLSSYHRSLVHDICTDIVPLFHCGVDGAIEGTRFVVVSIYSDGLDQVPGIAANNSCPSNNEQNRPWIMRKNLNSSDNTEAGKKLIWELIDQPGRCLRDACDAIDLRESKDLSSIQPPESGDARCLLVDTPEKMQECIRELEINKPTEIAFDLECFNRRKEQQMTCLIQLATNCGKTYIVDVLAKGVWDKVHGLSNIFADRSIVKIGHGIRGLDVQSLQRDFGIFVVNAFDTYEAAEVLKLEGKGLATVCAHYGLQSSELYHDLKRNYQATDWTQRPLTAPMILYGRYDVHYLIHLRKLMTMDLVRLEIMSNDTATSSLQDMITLMNEDDGVVEDENHADSNRGQPQVAERQQVFSAKDLRMNPGLMRVLSKSQEACLKFWNSNPEPPLKNKRFVAIAKAFTKSQLNLYRQLASWREDTSKEEEALPGNICSLDVLARIAFHRPLTMDGLRRIQYFLPPLLQSNENYTRAIFSFVRDSLAQDNLLVRDEVYPTFEEFSKRELSTKESGGATKESIVSNPMFWAVSCATISVLIYGFIGNRKRRG